MSNFRAFAKIVAESVKQILGSDKLFVVDLDGRKLFQTYLDSFPPGTNPIFVKRTEYDCACCKGFIRRMGIVVSIDADNTVHTIWETAARIAEEPFKTVSKALHDIVVAAAIDNKFLVTHKDTMFGAMQTVSVNEDGGIRTWDHFYMDPIPSRLRSTTKDKDLGDYKTRAQILLRGLVELEPSAVQTVIELIANNSLYRGAEKQNLVVQFRNMQSMFLRLTDPRKKELFVWRNASDSTAFFRSDVIGTLVEDLSCTIQVRTDDGDKFYVANKVIKTENGSIRAKELLDDWKDGKTKANHEMIEQEDNKTLVIVSVTSFEPSLEAAVRSFETKVAPANYQRTTALVTQGMIKDAIKKLDDLGLRPALERRFAVTSDVSVNDVIWVNAGVSRAMRDSLTDMLMSAAHVKNVSVDETKLENIHIEDFIKKIVPKSKMMEILFKGSHKPNLVSLTAPIHPNAKNLFNWTNGFAWSYTGNITDSIKEKVKAAGGKVEGVALRVSLSWFNLDDLDLHAEEPLQGKMTSHVFYANKRGAGGGVLDVDMNAGRGTTRSPVENIVWENPKDGDYRIFVVNYSKREDNDVGFVVEVENDHKISQYHYPRKTGTGGNVDVVSMTLKNKKIIKAEANPLMTTQGISQEVWGLKTEQYVKVNMLTLSPNYWGNNKVGNKHYIFILDGAINPEATRGIYNEFLSPEFSPHRKAFELIGDKTLCSPTTEQLSGLGFSSTKSDNITVKVQMETTSRLFNVIVGGTGEK